MQRNYFGIKFYARDSKATKDGTTPIEMSIDLNGTRKFVNLPMRVKPSDFNSKRRPKEIEEYISLMRIQVNEIMNEMLRRGEALTVDKIREYVRTGGYKPYTVEDLCNEYLALLSKRVDVDLTFDSYYKYKRAIDILYQSVDKNKELRTLTPSDIKNFHADVYKDYVASTACGILTKIKTIITYAKDNGKIDINLFSGTKISKGKNVVKFLTETDIEKIEGSTFDIDRIERVKDLFVFQVNSGLAYADLATLTPEDLKVEGNMHFIKKQRNKTGEVFTAVILPEGLRVWKKYEGKLPLLSNQKYNSYLKYIQDALGIKQTLTTHLARKSYCCRLLAHKVPIFTVSKCLGHSSTKVTQRYYAALTNMEILTEVNEAFK